MMHLCILLLLLHLPAGHWAAPITCYNDRGEPTDWFYLYKLPHLAHKRLGSGLNYQLLEKGSQGWVEGVVEVNDTAGAVGRTVGQLYEDRENGEIAYILYNDQKPKEANVTAGDNHEKGHTKGVVLLDKTQGFWLVHSTPHFPPPKDVGEFSYPHSGITYGQNFLCVTYPLETFQTIGEQLLINQPLVFDCDVPDSLAASVPLLVELCKGSQRGGRHGTLSSATNQSVSLTSLAGTEFISFAKGASFASDLYSSWVAPALRSNLFVQFWLQSAGILPSDCAHTWKVLNGKTISLANSFNSTRDHSKWAVSVEGVTGGGVEPWICVGDINRNEAEERRGGGTVCQRDALVWKAYRTAAEEYYPCEGE